MNFGYFGVFWRIISGILVYHYPPPPPADPDNSTTGYIQPPLSSHLPKGGYLMEVQPSNEPGVRGGGGSSHIRVTAMLVRKLKLDP